MRIPPRTLLPRTLQIASLIACAAASGAAAQDAPLSQSTPAAPPAPAAPNQDITVTGYNATPVNSALPGQGAQASRIANSDSRAFLRCIKKVDPARLRPIVEGHARDPKTHDALDWVIRTQPGCYRGAYTSPLPTSPFYGDCNPIPIGKYTVCRAVYDRGSLIEFAFNKYAPKFMLTRRDTLGKPVIERFRAREAARGKFRSPIDRKFYDVAACMVQLEPERAIRMLRAEPGLEKEARFRKEIISKTPYCTDNAKKVQVDPYQFRVYIADAVYHWTIAAKGLETLIPTS
ncbi:MAG: hypothetical protein EOP62_12485 [Sphingomonadales bacterium]|nr:MAG: hypothetical protein EOP62_12485 [Sphingomonadales bacterium]